jgi:hypothetical protein
MRKTHLLAPALSLLVLASACEKGPESAQVVTAVGIQAGNGPHQGVVKEARGTRVELVPMKDGSLRAYLSDDKGVPIRADGQITATVAAPSFAPAEVILVPAEDGAYFAGRLPGQPPTAPAEISLAFPQGVSLTYPEVPLVAEVVIAPPVVAVAGVPGDFAPPHKGTVTRVGDSLVEVVIAPKGEVQAYAYTAAGVPIPVAEVGIPELEITYQQKPYKVKMKPATGGAYLMGTIDAEVRIPAQAEIAVACPQPVTIHGVVYEPAVVVFPAYVAYEPIVIVPAAVVVTPAVVAPAVVITPPHIEIGIGVGVTVGHSHSHKGKGHYKHKHKHSH